MKRISLLLTIAAAVVAVAAPSGASARSKGLTISARTSAYGTVLFDGSGRALYAFTIDTATTSKCFGACAKAWPVTYTAAAPRAGKGTRQRLLGTIRHGKRRQVTYGGHPLYYYHGDGTGQIRCQNVDEFGGTWLVVAPDGKHVR